MKIKGKLIDVLYKEQSLYGEIMDGLEGIIEVNEDRDEGFYGFRRCVKCNKMYIASMRQSGLCNECIKKDKEDAEKFVQNKINAFQHSLSEEEITIDNALEEKCKKCTYLNNGYYCNPPIKEMVSRKECKQYKPKIDWDSLKIDTWALDKLNNEGMRRYKVDFVIDTFNKLIDILKQNSIGYKMDEDKLKEG